MEIFKILKFRTPISLYSRYSCSKRKPTLILTKTPSMHFIHKSAVIWNTVHKQIDYINTNDFSLNIGTWKKCFKKLLLTKQGKYDKNEWCDYNFSLLHCT